jgi:membrane-associated HD superfamily phosphohydrolase
MIRMERNRPMRRLVWGLFLIAIGSLFLLDHMGMLRVPNVGTLWPAIFIAIALIHVLEGRFGSALTFLILGFWFFACEFGWYGFNYGNSWPLVMIAVGAGIVVRALGGEPGRGRMSDGGAS